MRFALGLAGLICVILAGAWARAADAPPPRPNVLVIVADDLGYADVGFNGGAEIKTPHIDSIAAAGARLAQFYVQPVCSPTRAALLTGRYPMRYGLQVGVVRPWADYGLPLEERTLAAALKEAGYFTAICGKWHLGHAARDHLPTQRGFDHQYGHYNGAIDYFTHERDGGLDWHRNDKPRREEGYSTTLIADEAARIIREHGGGGVGGGGGEKPFFLYVPFNAVHTPLQAPDKYIEPYQHLPERRRVYAGMLAAMDEGIGKILAALDEKKLREQTLIIFTSDNGGFSPARVTDNGPLRAGKHTLYEGGVRVAACAAWPGKIPAGSVVDQPIHIVDLYPTLLKLAGATLDQKLPIDGKDAWATIAEGAKTPHEQILLNAAPQNGAIRVGDFKLILNSEAGRRRRGQDGRAGGDDERMELFNLAADPSEKQNLAQEHPEKVKSLRARYDALAAQAVAPKSKPQPADYQAPPVWGQPPHDFSRWEKEISAFEAQDKANPPAPGGIVFTGSSTIRGWRTLAEDFPGQNVINRGFGGSQIVDATHFADRIVTKYAPRQVFLRSGGNDIHLGKSAEQVFHDFKDFVAAIHAKSPETEVVFIGWAPAPSRWDERHENKKLNDLVAAWAKQTPRVKYIETYDTTANADDTPKEELFVKDRLHFNAAGYKALAERVRPYVGQSGD